MKLGAPDVSATLHQGTGNKAEALAGSLRRASNPDELRKAARDFESLFLTQVVKAMRKTVPEGGLFKRGLADNIYQEMLDEEYGKGLAQSQGMGLADVIVDQLSPALGQGAPAARLPVVVASVPRWVPAPAAFSMPGGALAAQPWANAAGADFARPVPGRITSGFGWRRDPIDGDTRFHRGLDLSAPTGMPVLAAQAGRVVKAGPNAGYGLAVVIEHVSGSPQDPRTVRTRYGHNSELLVSPGDVVARGQPIARAGSTGRSTGSHVHFELWVNGEPVDPRIHAGVR